MIIAAGSRLSTYSHIDDCYGSLILEAEAELGAFHTAIREMFGERLAFIAVNLWLEELEMAEQGRSPRCRLITVAAASRLADAVGVPRAAPSSSSRVSEIASLRSN